MNVTIELNNTRHPFDIDAPKDKPSEDLLDRSVFSKEVARTLVDWQSNKTLVVSLCGDWGSGKTTICNFMKFYLKEMDPAVLIVDFNPWEWSGQDKIFEGFFQQIGLLFKKTDRLNKTIELLKQWKSLQFTMKATGVIGDQLPKWVLGIIGGLTLVSVGTGSLLQNWWIVSGTGIAASLVFLSGLSKIPEYFASFLQSDKAKSLEEIRGEISKELLKLKRPVIIFIDDIDRLTNREIALLFQLVKANVQLPNVVFFLMFQKKLVTTAIKDLVAEDGAKYLRKIVQVEWQTPTPEPARLREILTKDLNEILTQEKAIVKWDPERWNSLFFDGIWPFFENLRDIRRFIGSFRFYFQMQKNGNVLEVNAVDFLAIEVVRVFSNDVYLALSRSADWIPDWKMSLAWLGKKAPDEAKERVGEMLKLHTGSEAEKRALTIIFEKLFPEIYGHGNSQEVFRKDLRICHPSHFKKYFRGTLDSNNSIASLWHEFLRINNDQQAIYKFFKRLIEENVIEDFLLHLVAAKIDIDRTRLFPVLTALLDIGDEFRPSKASIDPVDPKLLSQRFIRFRLLEEDEVTRSTIMKQALTQSSGFFLPIDFISYEDELTRKRHPEDRPWVIAEKDVKWLQEHALKLIRKKAATSDSLLRDERCEFIFFRWHNWAPEEAKEYVVKAASTPPTAVLLLSRLSGRMQGPNHEEPFLQRSSIEIFIPLEQLKEQVDSLPSEDLSERERNCKLLLDTAVSKKLAGLPYEQIHLRDCN